MGLRTAVLISTYEMGRQPFGLASPAAWLERAGWDVVCLDLAKAPFDEAAVRSADLVAFHLPMHTATRLAAPLVGRVRRLNPAARISAYGLYAPLNAEWLRAIGVDHVIGGEFEEALTRWAGAPNLDRGSAADPAGPGGPGGPGGIDERALPRLKFLVPDRAGLPPLSRYAALQLPGGGQRIAGYTEATRGCIHLCRHCPVVPIYRGQFRVVQAEVVLADIDAQVAAGAAHITFGDPDFFNGPTHAMRLVEQLNRMHPGVTYDVTIKIEHLLRYRRLLPRLARTGCAFVTSAVESVDDRVLRLLAKGHTRHDFEVAARLCREAGVTLVPTFVAFHPWLSLSGYCDLVDTIARLDLVEAVAPIQLAIRLLVPRGSLLLDLDEMRPCLGGFDPATLTYRWSHPDPRVDALHEEVSKIVVEGGDRLNADRAGAFARISTLAHRRAGIALSADVPGAPRGPARDRATVPYLNEPWYC